MNKFKLGITLSLSLSLSLSAIAVSSCLLTTSCSQDKLIKFGPYSFYKSTVVFVEFYTNELRIYFLGQHSIIVNYQESYYSDAVQAMHRAGF